MSNALKEYQFSSQSESLTTFLKNNGFSGSKIMNLVIPYDDEIAKRLRDGNFFTTSGGRNEAGITLRMVEGEKIELFVAFIWLSFELM